MWALGAQNVEHICGGINHRLAMLRRLLSQGASTNVRKLTRTADVWRL